MRLPTVFIPHGAGPCFFMDWTRGPPTAGRPWPIGSRGRIAFRDTVTDVVVSGIEFGA